jgi:hypothetical protein
MSLVQMKAHLARTRGASRFDDLILYRVAHYFADGVHLEFSHDIGPMSFGGLNAYSERHRYFLAALSFGEELNNFALARRESVP